MSDRETLEMVLVLVFLLLVPVPVGSVLVGWNRANPQAVGTFYAFLGSLSVFLGAAVLIPEDGARVSLIFFGFILALFNAAAVYGTIRQSPLQRSVAVAAKASTVLIGFYGSLIMFVLLTLYATGDLAWEMSQLSLHGDGDRAWGGMMLLGFLAAACALVIRGFLGAQHKKEFPHFFLPGLVSTLFFYALLSEILGRQLSLEHRQLAAACLAPLAVLLLGVSSRASQEDPSVVREGGWELRNTEDWSFLRAHRRSVLALWDAPIECSGPSEPPLSFSFRNIAASDTTITVALVWAFIFTRSIQGGVYILKPGMGTFFLSWSCLLLIWSQVGRSVVIEPKSREVWVFRDLWGWRFNKQKTSWDEYEYLTWGPREVQLKPRNPAKPLLTLARFEAQSPQVEGTARKLAEVYNLRVQPP